MLSVVITYTQNNILFFLFKIKYYVYLKIMEQRWQEETFGVDGYVYGISGSFLGIGMCPNSRCLH